MTSSATAAIVITTTRSRNLPLVLCRNRHAVSSTADTANMPHAPREKEKKMPAVMMSSGTARSGMRDTGPVNSR
nr:hypothetical protein [Mesorhizobium sp. BH1-1-5]